MMKGYSLFKCPLCRYSVTTQEFSSLNGNCRTQAAKAMNQHATAEHDRRTILKSPRDAQMYPRSLTVHNSPDAMKGSAV
jgi:uncharacterized protein (DUF2225 family)